MSQKNRSDGFSVGESLFLPLLPSNTLSFEWRNGRAGALVLRLQTAHERLGTQIRLELL